jgi:4-carboxymuconolactone decarboxylase
LFCRCFGLPKQRLLLFINTNMIFQEDSLSQGFGPSLGHILNAIFGRHSLSPERRSLCSLSCLQAVGDFENLQAFLQLVLPDLCTASDVYEVFLQGYLFCGYPRAIESFMTLDDLLKKEGTMSDNPGHPARQNPKILGSSDILLSRGQETARLVHRDNFERILNKISAVSPDLGYLMIAEGYGHIMCRPELGLQERELAVISSLTALAAPRQLNSHIRGAMNVGCSVDETFEAILTDIPWVGTYSVQKAVEVWADVAGKKVVDIGDEYSNLSV